MTEAVIWAGEEFLASEGGVVLVGGPCFVEADLFQFALGLHAGCGTLDDLVDPLSGPSSIILCPGISRRVALFWASFGPDPARVVQFLCPTKRRCGYLRSCV